MYETLENLSDQNIRDLVSSKDQDFIRALKLKLSKLDDGNVLLFNNIENRKLYGFKSDTDFIKDYLDPLKEVLPFKLIYEESYPIITDVAHYYNGSDGDMFISTNYYKELKAKTSSDKFLILPHYTGDILPHTKPKAEKLYDYLNTISRQYNEAAINKNDELAAQLKQAKLDIREYIQQLDTLETYNFYEFVDDFLLEIIESVIQSPIIIDFEVSSGSFASNNSDYAYSGLNQFNFKGNYKNNEFVNSEHNYK